VLRNATAWTDLLSAFPRQASRIMTQVERGDLRFRIDAPMPKQTAKHWNQVANRVILGVVLAALILAMALLIPPLNLTWPWGIKVWVVVLGFIAMCVVGSWLFLSILRSNNGR